VVSLKDLVCCGFLKGFGFRAAVVSHKDLGFRATMVSHKGLGPPWFPSRV
jgi:hypothetical protein